MLYPSGCLNPITLHIYPIMFTGRTNALHIASRVSGFVRAGLTALPPVIQPPCDRLRYPLLTDCVGLTSYQSAPKAQRITLLTPALARRGGSWLVLWKRSTQRLMR